MESKWQQMELWTLFYLDPWTSYSLINILNGYRLTYKMFSSWDVAIHRSWASDKNPSSLYHSIQATIQYRRVNIDLYAILFRCKVLLEQPIGIHISEKYHSSIAFNSFSKILFLSWHFVGKCRYWCVIASINSMLGIWCVLSPLCKNVIVCQCCVEFLAL